MRILLFVCLSIIPIFSWSQTLIKAVVLSDKNPVENALVTIAKQNGITNQSGVFEIELQDTGRQILQIFHLSMEKFQKEIDLKNGINDLGTIEIQYNSYTLDEMSVLSTRVTQEDPFSFNEISAETIKKQNLGQDLPYLLDQLPSVVVSSDAGNGIGYTGIRIRGTDPTRTNVTINGIPINDSESQGLWWVNMPDLASSTDNIQVQRGLGASTNGGSAFGASINLNTSKVKDKAELIFSNSYGSFNSRKHTLQFSTGLFQNHWFAEARLSHIQSDGFIDRASSSLQSYFVNAGYLSDKSMIQFTHFAGKEKTYQAWGAVPIQYIDSVPTFNPYTYENETDNYTQSHYQLHWNQSWNEKIKSNLSLHYTKGFGYYEQYRNNELLADYLIQSTDSTVNSSDLIRQRWLDNDFYGFVYGLQYENKNLQIVWGGGWNRYKGAHFGKVIWARYAGNSEINHEYYRNDAEKWDGNTYLKLNYQLKNKWNFYADLQHRYINYQFLGYNNQLDQISQDAVYHFFNPKIGLSFFPTPQQKIYFSLAMGHREPNRDDFTASSPESRPRPERLINLELGYRKQFKKASIECNYYLMYYQDQLVLTGKINDVGAFTRQNVPISYRTGIELQSQWYILPQLLLSGNIAYSINKITAFKEFIDNWADGTQMEVEHKNTDISFSPNWVGSAQLQWDVFSFHSKTSIKQELQLAIISKYVGKQFIDNSSNDLRSLPGFWVNDFRLTYQLGTKLCKELRLNFILKNFTNTFYANNAWTYRFYSPGYDPRNDDPYSTADQGDYYQMIGLFPQARINFMIGLDLKF